MLGPPRTKEGTPHPAERRNVSLYSILSAFNASRFGPSREGVGLPNGLPNNNRCQDNIQHQKHLMPYSKQHNVFFFHITKTAGTSIEKTLGIYRDKTPVEGKTESIFGKNRQHFTYDSLVHFDLVDKQFFANSICFTIVRNPLDRLVSEYFWIGVTGTFKEFVINEYLPGYKLIEENPFKPPHVRYSHYYPQYLYECEPMTEYLLFDNLDRDWKRFVDKYKLNLPKVLPVTKRGKRRGKNVEKNDFLSCYDPELLSLARQGLDKDIKFYERIKASFQTK